MTAARGSMRYRATIERATPVPDGGGEQAKAWAPIATAVPCWAWLKGTTVVQEGGKSTVVDARHVTVPTGTDVRVGDRVTVRDRRETRVIFAAMTIDGTAERPDHLLLMARRVA